MAIRGSFHVALDPKVYWAAQPWLNTLRHLFKTYPKLVATGFATSIASFHEPDEAKASAMYAGTFTVSGETVKTTAQTLFTATVGSAKWQAKIHDLSWLQSFAASKRKLHCHFAMQLLLRWAKAKKPTRLVSTQSNVVLALALHGAALTQKVDQKLQKLFLQIVTSEINRLHRMSVKTAEEAALKAIALLYVATTFRGLASVQKPALDLLNSNIDKVDLSAPETLVDFLGLLLPLKSAVGQTHQYFLLETEAVIHAMMSQLTKLRHGNGDIAFLAHSTGAAEHIKALAKIGVFETARSQKDFTRLATGKSCLITNAQNNFEIEFSEAQHLIFKCFTNDEFVRKTRSTLNEAEQGIVATVETTEARQRTYYLSANGTDLRIEDVHRQKLEIMFAVNADIKIAALRESTDLLLLLPDRSAWKLSLRGATATIEPNGNVIKLQSNGQGCINWALKKQAKISKQPTRKQSQTPDLLG
jgi:hypothetical protein